MAVTASSGASLELLAPLAGWVLPLAEVPDPVFAGAMAGDGVAIDPTGESLHAPCDGVIALLGANRHALTVQANGVDVLMHVGIDTMKLEGAGFRLHVRHGELVRAGQMLLEFDLDAIVRGAPSAITPVLLTGQHPGRIVRRQSERRVAVGDFLYAVEATAAVTRASHVTALVMAPAAVRRFRVPFEHGLHARPAAQVAAALANLDAEVSLRAHGREANARSVVAMMALGVTHGEVVIASAHGREADAALAALDVLLERATESPLVRGPVPRAAPPAPGARLRGLVAARGLVTGFAAPLMSAELPIGPALGDQAAERVRLLAAIDAVTKFLKRLGESGEGARRDLLEAHLALLSDPQLLCDAEAALAGGASAGLAWRAAARAAADALLAIDDPRMAERRADLLDIERQVLQVLSGATAGNHVLLPERAIVIADELLPSQLLSLDASRLVGLCTAEGGATSHVAILAASMGLPTLVAVGAPVLAIAAGTPLVLDADAGVLLVDPPAPERDRLDAQVAARREQQVRDQAAAHLPAMLRDGTVIHIYCNLGAVADAAPAVRAGAEGCGLLRTEFLFLARSQAPDESEQLAQYQAIADALAGRPLTVRTLDAGGDKPISYLAMPREPNPALGLRGLRTSLARPELLTTQLRAISRVTPAGQCRVLLPMVTDLDDLRAVRARLSAAAGALEVPAPPLGVMIETPAAALLADQLAAECDFLSIGSNDLSQYTLAMDRLHPALAERLDGLHPAVLRLIEGTTRAGGAQRIETGVCGNLASDPDAVPLLIGLGIRELSVVPAQIPRLKALLRTLETRACADLARRALERVNASEVRALVRTWSKPHA
jgi:phosphoenolpyruvate-protein phosphotransferase